VYWRYRPRVSSDADQSTVEIGVAGPQSDVRGLRAAYLDLLKLCLCDLGAQSTREIMWDDQKRAYFRDLQGEAEFWRRAEGKDWPLAGLTMVGLPRLRDLQACVEYVIEDHVEGDLIEAGAWRGGASILMRATLDSLGADDRTVWVADSFQGFPKAEENGTAADRDLALELSGEDYFAPTLEEVRGYFARFGCDRGVRFVPGFFEETMSGIRGRRWALVRLDADTYKATMVTLEALYPGLSAGGFLVIDDYFHPFLPESCRKAVDDFRERHGITEPIEQIDWNGGRWRRESGSEAAAAPALTPVDPGHESCLDHDPPHRSPPVPSARELHLQDDLQTLQSRIRELEARLEAVNRPRVWGRRRRTA
jgi:hypothetical protein